MQDDEVDLFTQLHGAYIAFRELGGYSFNRNTRIQFFNFLGLDESHVDAWYNLKVGKLSDEAKGKVAWLTGPHARTIFKAWQAKHYG